MEKSPSQYYEDEVKTYASNIAGMHTSTCPTTMAPRAIGGLSPLFTAVEVTVFS